MWPFDKSVIINYTVEGYSPVGYDVKFFGSLDGGTITFPLEERGTLRRDGADGAIPRPGQYKAVWTPDDSFIGTVLDDMLIKVEISEPATDGLYMVVDLESGLVRFLHGVPEGGWTDEYRTTKMVFRRVEAVTFTMGSPTGEISREDDEKQHEVTLTKPFFIAVFETTQKQYETIMGKNPAAFKGDMRPVERVSYEAIRGSEKGKGWPANGDVDEDSFMGKLRAKTGSAFDLPTEAQWECACRAGTTTALNNGTNLANVDEDENMNKLGRYDYDRNDGKGGYTQHTAVGSYLSNAWGLYDMHGNVSEWCLDWYGVYEGDTTDPAGPSEGSRRVLRGGSFDNSAYSCRSARRISISPSDYDSHYGFRVALIPE